MSQVEALSLVEFEITLAPGFIEPFRVVPAARGLVLVVGPNESGKSTLARALSNVLWPGSIPSAELECEARFRLGPRALRAIHRGGKTRWLEAGVECETPKLPPLELASCYRLSVEESGESTRPLAEQVVRALAGGFDVAAARASFQPRPASRAYTNWKQAVDVLRKLQSEEDQLAGQQSRLEELGAQLADERALHAEAAALESMRELQDARGNLARIEPELAQLAGCERVNPEHGPKLKSLTRDVEAARKEQRAAQLILDELRQSLAAQPLPESARDMAALEACRSDARRLLELERRRDQAQSALAAAQASFQRWGAQVAGQDQPPLPEAELQRFDGLAKEWQEIKAFESQYLQSKSMYAVAAKPAAGAERGAMHPAFAVVAGGAIVGGILAGSVIGPSYFGVAALGLIALIAGWILRPQAGHAVDTTASVLQHLEEEFQRRITRRSELEAQLQAFESNWGLTPGLSSAAQREALARRVKDHGDLVGARAAAQQAEADFDELCDALMARVQSFGQEPQQGANGLLQQVEATIERARGQQAARESERTQQRLQDAAAETLRRAEEAVASLFREAGLENGDREGLQRLIEQRPRFKELQAQHTIAAHARDRALASLQAWQGWRPNSAAELMERSEASRQAGLRATALATEIRDIERDIEARRGKDVIEEARARVRAAEDALSELREQAFDAAAAVTLLDDVERDLESGAALPVLSRAIELFSTFTGGRHRLSLEKGEQGRADFRARDLQLQRDVALDGLSSGTRAQLLLAARVAFAVEEAGKAGVRPPLLLDEALATSDEARFEATARAVLALVADGWQVIYLTSQRSDIARWSSEAARAECTQLELIELDRARRQASAVREANDLLVPAPRALPAPGGRGAEAYALELQVPPLDLEQPLGHQHVFHLLRDDLEFVHTLALLHAERLGIAEGLTRDGGGAIDATRRANLLSRIDLLRAFHDLWSVGRGRAVDRDALDEAGVTENFRERVLALARKRGGDAALLIDALEQKELPGFGSAKTESLDQSLQAQGRLDRRPRFELDEIVGRAAAAVPALAHGEAARLCEQWWSAAENSWRRRREPTPEPDRV